MSIIFPRFVTRIIFPICFCSLTFLIKNRCKTSSRMFLMRKESKMMFLDCFNPRFILRSNLSGLFVMGDLISKQTPFNKISAVFAFDSSIKTTSKPASARILAILSSCLHGFLFAGIIILPFFMTERLAQLGRIHNPIPCGYGLISY